MTGPNYLGSELDLFREARNWKSYWSRQLRPFIGGEVLEVGAGIGSNTGLLDDGNSGVWTCVEPDPRLVEQLSRNLKSRSGVPYEIVCGTLQSMGERRFDTILYVDVLEHIEDDRAELRDAAAHLRPDGHIAVLAPAHQCMRTPFDTAVGHFRRYDRSTLRKISPEGLRIERMRYLDCAGLAASLANLLVLRQSMPTAAQLRAWDRWMIPVSRRLDPLLGFTLGKSILGVWRNPGRG